MSGLTRRNMVGGLLAAGLCLPAGSASLAWSARSATAFGTVVSIRCASFDPARNEQAIDAGFRAIRRIEREMSLFDPGSSLSRLNRDGLLLSPAPLLLETLRTSREVWQLTGGAFDPTVQPLWNLWRDGEVTEAGINRARGLLGLQHVSLDPSIIVFRKRGMALTFNGIAQGLAADLVCDCLRSHGMIAGVVDSGELGVLDMDVEKEVLIGIADPRRPGAIVGTLKQGAGFIATSGDYATSFAADFSAHHIFDPATGRSPTGLASATVLAPSGAMADALATAVMVMGRDRSMALVEALPQAGGIFIAKDGGLAITPNLRGRFRSS